MAVLLHELWIQPDDLPMLCLAGPMGDGARGLLPPGSRLTWTVEGESHFDVMTKYWAYMKCGTYWTDQPWDFQPYPDEWLEVQKGRS